MRKITLLLVFSMMLACAMGVSIRAASDEPSGLLGDVTLDGQVNVLDVQKSINQALGMESASPEADLDGNDSVDVRDVQNLINSALGTGGVFQALTGLVAGLGAPLEDVSVAAISDIGLVAAGDLSPEGRFDLTLRTGMGWGLVLVGSENQTLGWFEFPVDDYVSSTLPLPPLSIGEVMDLGELDLGAGPLVEQDVRALVSQILAPIDLEDADENGVPDFLEAFLDPIFVLAGPYLALLPPGQGEIPPDEFLMDQLSQCIADSSEELVRPTLIDDNDDGVLDCLEPLLACIQDTLIAFVEMDDWGVPISSFLEDSNSDGVPDLIEMVMDVLVAAIPAWINSMDRPELTDVNADGIPDFLEDGLVVPGTFGGDWFPCPWRDSDSDGVADWLDPDDRPSGDNDADGVPDEYDWDDDNDGIPDYADPDPLIPDIDLLER